MSGGSPPQVGLLPVYLVFSAVELAVVAWVYRRLLAVQGRLLERRREFILERVTAAVG